MKLGLASLVFLPLISSVQALHFYFSADEKRCFIEETPSDTVVEGHYRAQLYNTDTNKWEDNTELGITVNVMEMATNHVVVNTVGPNDGRFTFTSHEPGDHNICLTSNITSSLFSTTHIKMYLDINVGSAKHDTQHDIAHVNTLAGKIKDLTNKVEDIKREQRYMREVEEQFRNASETVNSKAVWWSIGQIVVLLGAAVWQMRYLKDYFGDKKLR